MIDSSINVLARTAAPSAIRAMYKTSAGRAELMRRASEGSRGFVSRAETMVTGRKRRRQTPPEKVALAILKYVPGGEARFAFAAHEAGMASAGLLERVASRAKRSAAPEDIIRMRRGALELDPQQAHRYVALAEALEAQTERQVVHDPAVGLHHGQKSPHAEEVITLLKDAQRRSPENVTITFMLGERLVERGDSAEGLVQLEKAALKAPDEQRLLALAQAYRRPDIAQFSHALDSYEQVFSADSKNERALSGLVHTGARGPMDWPRIWRSVRRVEARRKQSPFFRDEIAESLDILFRGDEQTASAQVDGLVTMLDDSQSVGEELHHQTVALLVLRFQFLGWFEAGFRLRARNAQRRLQRLRRRGIRDIRTLRQAMQALVYLEDSETASRVSTDADYWAQSGEEKSAAAKLHADAELMLGKAEPYFRYSEEARKKVQLPADRTMAELVRNKRVAIVGPAATGEALGAEIDSYDVVVRPNFNPDFVASHPESMGSRTDIAYYSGQDMSTLIDDVEKLVENSGVQLINTRSFSYHAHQHRNLPWLRFSRHDWSLSFHGSPLGIQRMIYDLLQFRPDEIAIFNSDFYTGSGEFAEGYRKKRSFAPGSFMNDLVVVHDLLTDFRFTQAMLRTGYVTAKGRAAEVLSREPSEYLKDVEEAGVLS